MHRVVTKRFDHHGNWVVEVGPWLVSRIDAENWATIFRHMGYSVKVEDMHSSVAVDYDGDGLHEALSKMA